jgi:hypothetical protein
MCAAVLVSGCAGGDEASSKLERKVLSGPDGEHLKAALDSIDGGIVGDELRRCIAVLGTYMMPEGFLDAYFTPVSWASAYLGDLPFSIELDDSAYRYTYLATIGAAEDLCNDNSNDPDAALASTPPPGA